GHRENDQLECMRQTSLETVEGYSDIPSNDYNLLRHTTRKVLMKWRQVSHFLEVNEKPKSYISKSEKIFPNNLPESPQLYNL
ncbi:unnamed protein product, partial [marine sediment metagenome]